MTINLLVIGTLKTSWIATGVAEYVGRIKGRYSVNIIELPASKQKDPTKQAHEECERIQNYITKQSGEIWILDERGTSVTSVDFAQQLEVKKDQGITVTFVIGGAYGLNEAIRGKATRVLCLSKMTLPHELCKLVFVEQLYRAIQIMQGSGYHH